MVPSLAPANLSPRPSVPRALVAFSFPEMSLERLEVAVRASSSPGTRAGGTSAPTTHLGPPLLIPHPLLTSPSLVWGARPQASMAWGPHWWLLQAWRRGRGPWPHSKAAGSPYCRPAQHLMSATCMEAASPSSTPASPANNHPLGPWKAQPALAPASRTLALCPCVREPVTSRSPATPPQARASSEQPTPHHWPRSMPAAAPHPSPTPWWTYPSC